MIDDRMVLTEDGSAYHNTLTFDYRIQVEEHKENGCNPPLKRQRRDESREEQAQLAERQKKEREQEASSSSGGLNRTGRSQSSPEHQPP